MSKIKIESLAEKKLKEALKKRKPKLKDKKLNLCSHRKLGKKDDKKS